MTGHDGPCAAHQADQERTSHEQNYAMFARTITSAARAHLTPEHPVRKKIEQMWDYTCSHGMQGNPLRTTGT